ncbi:MAG: EF-hand domain-containing protein, partial [Albidovulum sp.]
MTKYLSLAVFPAALITGLSLAVMAEARGMGIGFDFEAVDTNSDGKVTPEEMQAFHQGHVAAMDTNSDGFIDNAEMQAFMTARMSERLEEMANRRIEAQDKDGDGKLSLAEAGQMP